MIRRSVALVAALAMMSAPAFAHGHAAHGGQLVEVSDYQFEFVLENAQTAPHIDMYVIDPKDKPVTTAKIQLRVSAPDGKRLVVPLKFEENHYTAQLGSKAKGDYNVVVLSTVGMKKLNSRFSFKI